MASSKPQCGGDALGSAPYDLPLHIAAVFIVFAASFVGVAFPVAAKKLPWMKIPPAVFFFCKHFGTGVLIATAFVHLLPTAFGSLSDPCLPDLFIEDYPAMPGVIMMAAMFALFMIEMALHTSGNGHSHGGAIGEGLHTNDAPVNNFYNHKRNESYSSEDTYWLDERNRGWAEKPENPFLDPPIFDMRGSDMPAWFVGFYNSYVAQINSLQSRIASMAPSKKPGDVPLLKKGNISTKARELGSTDDLETGEADPAVLRKMSMNITLLEGGILFHSVFVGITISVTNDGFIILLVAILFHQMFEGLGLGSRIAAVPYPKGSWKPWVLCIAFGVTCPLGQAIGLGIRKAYDPSSAFALIMVGSFNAFSSGLLIYAALVDLLAEDFLSAEADRTMAGKRKQAFFYVILGAMGMSIVGAFA